MQASASLGASFHELCFNDDFSTRQLLRISCKTLSGRAVRTMFIIAKDLDVEPLHGSSVMYMQHNHAYYALITGPACCTRICLLQSTYTAAQCILCTHALSKVF